MKNKYIFILFILITCSLKAKDIKSSVCNLQETMQNLVESAKNATEDEKNNTSFNDVIKKMNKKPLPLNETTNFDDFIEAEDYKEVDVKSLKLAEIYPDLNKEGYDFRAIRCYKIEFSKTFYSVVVTVLKTEHEMESVLINYNLNGTIIDSKVISYDEIAEGMSKIESRIEDNEITRNEIVDLEEKIETIEMFIIDKKGKITPKTPITANATLGESDLIDSAIEQLNLEQSKVSTDLLVLKKMPNNAQGTIIVIPEFVDSDEYHFELNSHIVIVNNQTGKILHSYFESSKTNNWVSDAIQLQEIKIDTAPYNISENERAFGVRVRYYGSSRANPYSKETISLFVKSGHTLKKVLCQYDVMNHWGEWDTTCAGEFTDVKSILILSKKKTNGRFNIIVQSEITDSEAFEDENGDCNATDKISNKKTILKFNGKEYNDKK